MSATDLLLDVMAQEFWLRVRARIAERKRQSYEDYLVAKRADPAIGPWDGWENEVPE